MKYVLKAYRGPATFEQTFTSYDAYLDQRAWLVANDWTIGVLEYPHARTLSSALVYGSH